MKSNPSVSDWEQILDIMIREIRKQTYGKDQKIPTENEMAARFGVSRSEIRRVYKRLKELGYIYSIRGCGSFYSGKRLRVPLSLVSGMSFSRKMEELGLPYHTENIEARTIQYNPNIYENIGAGPEESIWKISLLRYVNEEPVAIHTRYMRESLFPSLPENASAIQSSTQYIHEHGYPETASTDVQMAVTNISKRKRELLNMQYSQEAIVLTGKTIRPEDGLILELFTTTYRSNSFIFTLIE